MNSAENIPQNIVYVSGTHGSGKSTLIHRLIQDSSHKYEEIPRIPIPKSKDMMERVIIRHSRYYYQTFDDKIWGSKHPDKIGLRDRCKIDEDGYMCGFLKIGWVTSKQFDDYLFLDRLMFTPDKLPRNILFLNPPVPFTIENIKKRWSAGGLKKWMEDRFDYLEAVHNAFEEYLAQYDGNVLNLQATALEERVALVNNWVEKTVKRK